MAFQGDRGLGAAQGSPGRRALLRPKLLTRIPVLLAVVAAACADSGSSPVPTVHRPPPAPEVEVPPDFDRLTLQRGSHEFTFREDRPILVRYHLPAGYAPSTPIVFVMHGNGRTGDSYFRVWRQPAIDYGFLLVVPEFDAERYPGSRSYNLGNVFPGEEPTIRNPESDWTFTAIEDLFDVIREAAGSTRTAFRIYGHSAGSQFVHRLLMTRPDAPVERAVAANAGWYTMPTEEVRWPYGLGGSGFALSSLADRFQQDVTILLGDQDTDPNHPGLRRTPEALEQGPHRLARGHTFYRVAEAAAESLGVLFAWMLETVPGAEHRNSQMTPRAAAILAR